MGLNPARNPGLTGLDTWAANTSGARTDFALLKEEPLGNKAVAGSLASLGHGQGKAPWVVEAALDLDLDLSLGLNPSSPSSSSVTLNKLFNLSGLSFSIYQVV